MSVGLLLITHGPLGADLLRIATQIFGICPAAVEALEVVNDTPRETVIDQALLCADRLDQGDGVLVLTDLYGATPANIAAALLDLREGLRLITGVNLPMLLRALNYAALDLDSVTERALQGGRDGVRMCFGDGGRSSDS